MDGAFFVSRTELLSWANEVFQLNLSKVEQCSNGAVYCQIIDACHPGSVAMKKVNWAARDDHQSIPNYKALQQALDRVGIQRHIEVDKLVRGKYQDNLEMLQWIKTYFDRSFPAGADYDAVSRRFTDNLPDWARSADGAERPAPPREGLPRSNAGSRPGTGGYAGGPSQGPLGDGRAPAPVRSSLGRGRAGGSRSMSQAVAQEEHERLREEVVDLKITVDGLEMERDFYFQKLRDIEILCQALEGNPDPHMTTVKFAENVQRILYAKDEEDEGGQEDMG